MSEEKRSQAEEQAAVITVKQLPSGYYHVRGNGPCNWAQPPRWPCDEETLRAHTFPEAAEEFIQGALIVLEMEAEVDRMFAPASPDRERA